MLTPSRSRLSPSAQPTHPTLTLGPPPNASPTSLSQDEAHLLRNRNRQQIDLRTRTRELSVTEARLPEELRDVVPPVTCLKTPSLAFSLARNIAYVKSHQQRNKNRVGGWGRGEGTKGGGCFIHSGVRDGGAGRLCLMHVTDENEKKPKKKRKKKELTEPTAKVARILVPLQTGLVEEEARIAVPGIDSDEVPF